MRTSCILAVDDDALNRTIMEELLGEEYGVVTASNAEEAIQVATKLRPDIVLMDITMPGMDGYEACRQMRRQERLKYTKIILVSGKGLVSERLCGYEAGADDYVTKPYNHDELLAKIKVFLRLRFMEEMDDIKTEFLTLVAHETRTPLTKLLAASEILVGNLPVNDAERAQLASLIRNTSADLQKLLENGLQYCSLRAGKGSVKPEAVDAAEILKSAVEQLGPKAAELGASLELGVADAAEIETDRGTLASAMGLAVEAALDRAGRGGKVRLELQNGATGVCLTVCGPDSCTDPALIHLLLEPFRSPQTLHHSSGSVIKLPLAAELARRLQGSLSLELRPGGAKETRMLFPKKYDPSQAGAAEGAQRAA